MANNARVQRVSDEILKTLVTVLRKKIRDPRLEWVNITSVEVSKDLSYAKVYYTSLADKSNANQDNDNVTDKDIQKVFAKSLGFFRSSIAREMMLRTTPNLKFIQDTSSAYGRKMDDLIKKAREQDRDFIHKEDTSSEDIETPSSSDNENKGKRERLR